jgi:hypothetical protein
MMPQGLDEGLPAMKTSTRRQVLLPVAIAGAAALGVSAAPAAQEPQPKPRRRHNHEEPASSKATAEDHGPRELFAVVDAEGHLRRGMHVAGVRLLEQGLYEVVFRRDVRRGVYLATIGDHTYQGLPPFGYVSVVGRATDPRTVLVCTANNQGESVNMGFHLLVLCPDGYA